jgi:hypothetical protein
MISIWLDLRIYFLQKYRHPALQLVLNARHDSKLQDIEIRKADTWLCELFL